MINSKKLNTLEEFFFRNLLQSNIHQPNAQINWSVNNLGNTAEACVEERPQIDHRNSPSSSGYTTDAALVVGPSVN